MRRDGLVVLLLLVLLVSSSTADETAGTNTLVKLKGVVSAIPGTTNLQFKVESGPVYKVLSTRDAQALFADTNLLARTLVIKGKTHEKGPALEVIGNLHEIKNGKLFELEYDCDICSISTSFPGPCLCCREPVVLREIEVKADY